MDVWAGNSQTMKLPHLSNLRTTYVEGDYRPPTCWKRFHDSSHWNEVIAGINEEKFTSEQQLALYDPPAFIDYETPNEYGCRTQELRQERVEAYQHQMSSHLPDILMNTKPSQSFHSQQQQASFAPPEKEKERQATQYLNPSNSSYRGLESMHQPLERSPQTHRASPDDCSMISTKFDPKMPLSDDQLTIHPLVRKARKVPVANEYKDTKYWKRRVKNNEAARRSREAKRIKENRITMRARYLERENARLNKELNYLRTQLNRLTGRIANIEDATNGAS